MHIFYIGQDHPLSPYYRFNPPLKFVDRSLSSIEQTRCYISLKQSGHNDAASRLRSNSYLAEHPQEIETWVRHHHVRFDPEWVFHSRQVVFDIMIELVRPHRQSNGFRDAFLSVVRAFRDPKRVKFVLCSATHEMVWSSGFRQPDSCPDVDPWYPGYNVYGQCLDDLVQRYMSDDWRATLGTGAAYLDRWLGNSQRFKKTVLLLSDSQARHVEGIRGGNVFAISGGQYHDLVDAVRQFRINILDYSIIIINCGINSVQKSVQCQQESWQVMEHFLSHQPKGPDIILCTAAPHPDVTGIAKHSSYVETRLVGSGIHCINWSGRSYCPFDGQSFDTVNTRLFDDDVFHLNHMGFRLVMMECAKIVPDLKMVSFTMSKGRLSYRRDKDGRFVR